MLSCARIVGGANSGQQIALELAESREVEISVGEQLPALPQRPLGRNIWWWLTTLRVSGVTVGSRLGQRLSQGDVVIGGGLRKLKRHGVVARPRLVAGSGRTVSIDDGTAGAYDAIAWARASRPTTPRSRSRRSWTGAVGSVTSAG